MKIKDKYCVTTVLLFYTKYQSIHIFLNIYYIDFQRSVL